MPKQHDIRQRFESWPATRADPAAEWTSLETMGERIFEQDGANDVAKASDREAKRRRCWS
jgi:hypothetical protein